MVEVTAGNKMLDEADRLLERGMAERRTPEAFGPSLEQALDAFWNVAYQQGQEQRGHDDEEGTAQKAEDDLRCAIAALASHAEVVETPPPESHLRGLETAIRNAGIKARDDLLERMADGGTVDNDLADYMTRIVDACVSAALATKEGLAE